MPRFIAFINDYPINVEADDIHHATTLVSQAYAGQNVTIDIEPANGRSAPTAPSWKRVWLTLLAMSVVAWLFALFLPWWFWGFPHS